LTLKETNTLIIGASLSGLATAACLVKKGIDYLIIEQHGQVANPWHNHYERLHLHTNKRLSSLPFKKFGRKIPRYPSRKQVVDYLEQYRQAFNIDPLFNNKALSVKKEGGYWLTTTSNDTFRSQHVVMATGPFSKPRPISFKGMETFPGKILHSCEYKTGKDFAGQNVLVVGFGNSACEIAIDLYEQTSIPSMSVRSAVNVIPRDIAGIPVLEISMLMRGLSARLADTINAPLIRLLVGNINKLGLKKLPYGPLEQIVKYGNAPVLDIGTIEHIRKGHIKVYGKIDYIERSTVHFKDGRQKPFDAIIAGIGYYRDYAEFVETDKVRFEDLKHPVNRQEYFGKDGLYFCGYWISPTGQIREIASDAMAIAKHIVGREQM
jgi:cation diffusion facilitator CzcD-associated flavoprotein CzcO